MGKKTECRIQESEFQHDFARKGLEKWRTEVEGEHSASFLILTPVFCIPFSCILSHL
jgi:hypothetical protein